MSEYEWIPTEEMAPQEMVEWLRNSNLAEIGSEEGVWDYVRNIGQGAISGATTGMVAGPWGALAGAALGAGAGAARTAAQSSRPSPRPAPPVARPAAAPPPPTATFQPVAPSVSPAVAAQPPVEPAGGLSPALVQQLINLLPQVIRLAGSAQGVLRSEAAGELDESDWDNPAESATSTWIEAPAENDEPEVSSGETWDAYELGPIWEDNPAPEYPMASRFAPAHRNNYTRYNPTATQPLRPIRRIIIHITDGRRTDIAGPIQWFQLPEQYNSRGNRVRVSAHYVIGQDGEVVQMVRHNDIAHHAHGVNQDSIGIEHVAIVPRAGRSGLLPTPPQYCASAALVRWLCEQYHIPMDRQHILGHSEADSSTSHRDCPNALWDWDYFMRLVQGGVCQAPPSST